MKLHLCSSVISRVIASVYFEAPFCTITLCNFVVPTRSVWYVILFRETGVVHRITYIISFLLVVLFTQFIVDKIKKSRAVSS